MYHYIYSLPFTQIPVYQVYKAVLSGISQMVFNDTVMICETQIRFHTNRGCRFGKAQYWAGRLLFNRKTFRTINMLMTTVFRNQKKAIHIQHLFHPPIQPQDPFSYQTHFSPLHGKLNSSSWSDGVSPPLWSQVKFWYQCHLYPIIFSLCQPYKLTIPNKYTLI